MFHFNHSSNLDLNEVNSYTKEVFDQNTEKQFISSSQSIAKHLYECSLHPKVARGELIVTQISGIIYNNKSIEVIGIFKSENKDSFLKIIKKGSTIKVKSAPASC